MSTTHRRVDPTADAALLHEWVSQDRATFWGMTSKTCDEVSEIYAYIDDQEHLAAYLIEHDGAPIALFQTYDPFVDDIGDHYDRRHGDVGAHFFMAPEKPLHTGQVVRYCLGVLFTDRDVSRIVVEPDARNERAILLMRKVGFTLGPAVDLPHKPAQFAFLTRRAYQTRTLPCPADSSAGLRR